MHDDSECKRTKWLSALGSVKLRSARQHNSISTVFDDTLTLLLSSTWDDSIIASRNNSTLFPYKTRRATDLCLESRVCRGVNVVDTTVWKPDAETAGDRSRLPRRDIVLWLCGLCIALSRAEGEEPLRCPVSRWKECHQSHRKGGPSKW